MSQRLYATLAALKQPQALSAAKMLGEVLERPFEGDEWRESGMNACMDVATALVPEHVEAE